MWRQIIQWLEQHQLPCTFQKYFGISCPGCGMQNAFIALLKGNFWESIQSFPALLPMLSMLLLLIFHLKYHFSWGARVLKYLFFVSGTLIIIHYFYQTCRYN